MNLSLVLIVRSPTNPIIKVIQNLHSMPTTYQVILFPLITANTLTVQHQLKENHLTPACLHTIPEELRNNVGNHHPKLKVSSNLIVYLYFY